MQWCLDLLSWEVNPYEKAATSASFFCVHSSSKVSTLSFYFRRTYCQTKQNKYVTKSGLGSQSWVFLAPWSRSRLKKQELEQLGKKSGAGAPKKLAGSSALRYTDHKEIVQKKTIILIVLYFLQFYLSSLRVKEYFAKLNQ